MLIPATNRHYPGPHSNPNPKISTPEKRNPLIHRYISYYSWHESFLSYDQLYDLGIPRFRVAHTLLVIITPSGNGVAML